MAGSRWIRATRLKELERDNARLKRAVADLTLDKLILQEAAEGHVSAPVADVGVWRNAASVASWGIPVRPTLSAPQCLRLQATATSGHKTWFTLSTMRVTLSQELEQL